MKPFLHIYLLIGLALAFVFIVIFINKPAMYKKLFGYPNSSKIYVTELVFTCFTASVFWPIFLCIIIFNNKL